MSKGKKDQMNSEEALTDNDTLIMETLYGSTNIPMPDDPAWLPQTLKWPPKSYLIFAGDNLNDAFIYPAQGLQNRILGGAYGYNANTDNIELVRYHVYDDLNNALQSNKNIFAIFIFAHSYHGRKGFSSNLGATGKQYNIGIDEKVKDSIPVSNLYTANMMKIGFIHLYSCHAIGWFEKDIAHKMARHFGVPVWASSAGTSISPWNAAEKDKTGMATNVTARLYRDHEFGFFQWASPNE